MLAGNQIPFGGTRLGFVYVSIMEGGCLSKNFHGVGIGPLSKILAVKCKTFILINFCCSIRIQNSIIDFGILHTVYKLCFHQTICIIIKVQSFYQQALFIQKHCYLNASFMKSHNTCALMFMDNLDFIKMIQQTAIQF